MNISFDIHGVITKYPTIISNIGRVAKNLGHTIWICSGIPEIQAKQLIDNIVIYDKYFSIVDYHRSIGTQMYQKENGSWMMNKDYWNPTKGQWAEREQIDIHLDDSKVYGKYFPKSCEYILVDENFSKKFAILLNKLYNV